MMTTHWDQPQKAEDNDTQNSQSQNENQESGSPNTQIIYSLPNRFKIE